MFRAGEGATIRTEWSKSRLDSALAGPKSGAWSVCNQADRQAGRAKRFEVSNSAGSDPG